MATPSDATSAPGTAYTLVGFGAALDWRKTWFVELLPNSATCSFCSIACPGLYLLPCVHLACWRCYDGLRSMGPMCALDRNKFSPSETTWITLSFDSMKQRKIHCWNASNGCKAAGPMCQIIRHFRSQCGYHSVSCPACGLAMAHRSVTDHLKLHCSRGSLQHNHSIVPRHRPVCPGTVNEVSQQITATSVPDAGQTVNGLQDVRDSENVNSSTSLPVVGPSPATELPLDSFDTTFPTNLQLTKQGPVQLPQAEHVLEQTPTLSNVDEKNGGCAVQLNELPQKRARQRQFWSGQSSRRKRTRNLPASTRQLRGQEQK
ncbi:uncharacterized protein LOC142587832 [Dermacentor variabilis]|uniref:uncharacterized protein LOC142587832 n=1 Tax=Dermacentor variabilis TaxID=34621 RepID=UPI003F5C8F06